MSWTQELDQSAKEYADKLEYADYSADDMENAFKSGAKWAEDKFNNEAMLFTKWLKLNYVNIMQEMHGRFRKEEGIS